MFLGLWGHFPTSNPHGTKFWCHFLISLRHNQRAIPHIFSYVSHSNRRRLHDSTQAISLHIIQTAFPTDSLFRVKSKYVFPYTLWISHYSIHAKQPRWAFSNVIFYKFISIPKERRFRSIRWEKFPESGWRACETQAKHLSCRGCWPSLGYVHDRPTFSSKPLEGWLIQTTKLSCSKHSTAYKRKQTNVLTDKQASKQTNGRNQQQESAVGS